jgi:hypothetical protein
MDTVGEMHIPTTPIAHIFPTHRLNLLKGISSILGTRKKKLLEKGEWTIMEWDTV